MIRIKKNNFLLFTTVALCFFICTISCLSVSLQDNYPVIGKVEVVLFGKANPELKIADRLSQAEKNIFGKTFESESLFDRTNRIKSAVLGNSDLEDGLQNDYEITDFNDSETKPKTVSKKSKPLKTVQGYENNKTKEVNELAFLDLVLTNINNERSLRGLLPLIRDDIAQKVAGEQALDLIEKGSLSYYNKKNQNPDERYTTHGGTGAIVEILKGFEEENGKSIKLTELLAQQLVQAIIANPDDSQVLFSPYITQFGTGYAFSKSKGKFASVCEFVISSGVFEPLKPQINWGEKINISGTVKSPFKFKAVTLAYYDVKDFTDLNSEDGSFSDENLKPYFPPQDYIAYGDTAKSNFIKVIKGLGVIGAIGGAPFTGGATAILAPSLISSIQNGPPKEIPFKGGIKANSKGEFHGKIDLNYQGMSGLYLISVLGELPGVNYPIVISRRTIRVNSPLQPVGQT